MKAMIFAAGFGTRLQPLTNNKPKALVEINGTTLLEIVINRLKFFGFNDIIINVHHFSDMIIDFLKKNNNFNTNITISDESGAILDTGGGLKKASWFFNDNKAFLVHNVDVISDINLSEMYNKHIKSDAIATLAVRNRNSSRYFLFDEDKSLCAWKNTKTNEIKIAKETNFKLTPFAFSGIHVINPEIFKQINEKGKFSIVDVYLKLAATNKIMAFNHDKSLWFDVGDRNKLLEASKCINQI
ncbi:MAG: nucleotidyltransferase family protein [Bacteroidetes bacterium]|nr:nucleotidyltransferase family protein [Bacteroidota bacterium]